MFGYSGDRFGARAEYLSIPEAGPLATMPSNLTYEEIAAITAHAARIPSPLFPPRFTFAGFRVPA